MILKFGDRSPAAIVFCDSIPDRGMKGGLRFATIGRLFSRILRLRRGQPEYAIRTAIRGCT